ncbi:MULTISPECIES: cell division protein FtsL [unclassified Caulobacter]|uniref:cell division protein FtsL n=1 Tax=unclassified Caulobacter TaxID=2648921 RepID=UPI000D3642A4|nr:MULTISPECIES: cell division protein [unclassified Caulobacter]PTS81634.1 cell division protein [Caulobacter sp. HMWF009]PTT08803.1 cell division protein [Caulobacter sp. HMWF025]
MSLSDLFNKRIRGFRVVEVVGGGVLLTLVTGVYLAKTVAGRERNEIAGIEREIEDEKAQKRLLLAEVAHLEQPRRIESLALAVGLVPIPAEREITEDMLVDVARHQIQPKPVAQATDVAPGALATDAPEAVPEDAVPAAPAVPGAAR